MLTGDLALLLATAIWGSTFVMIKSSLTTVEPFTFTALRFSLAFVVLSPIAWRRRARLGQQAIIAGAVAGMFLFVGFALQTVGLHYTTASKAGFITSLCVVAVPFLAWALLRQVPSPLASLGVVVATAGLALLSFKDDWTLGSGDVLMLVCAIAMAVQVVLVGKYAPHVDFVALATLQILMVAVASGACALALERVPASLSVDAVMAIAFTGIAATALVNLVQCRAQAFTTPMRAGLIYSLQPVFAGLFAWWWAGETLTSRAVLGCALILLGMLLAQLMPGRIWAAVRGECSPMEDASRVAGRMDATPNRVPDQRGG